MTDLDALERVRLALYRKLDGADSGWWRYVSDGDLRALLRLLDAPRVRGCVMRPAEGAEPTLASFSVFEPFPTYAHLATPATAIILFDKVEEKP